MTTVSEQPTQSQLLDAARARLIASLREMADWLEANPAVDLGPYPGGNVGVSVDTIDEVGRAANVGKLDLEKRHSASGTHYRAYKTFGPINFAVVAILPDPAVKA
jgi:hypothetical protein